MRKYEKQALKVGTIAVVMVLFSLILLPGILVLGGSALIHKTTIDSQVLPQVEGSVNSDAIQVAVYRKEKGKVEEVPLEEYVLGVVSSEMPASFHEEALKAQAVAARTYALSKIKRSASGNPEAHPKAPLCDSTHCQVYRTEGELKKIKGQGWMDAGKISGKEQKKGEVTPGYQKIIRAVNATRGQVMYYQGNLVEQPLFHSASGGRTENSEDVFRTAYPYLKSVDSAYESEAPHQEEVVTFSFDGFVRKMVNLDSAARGASKRSVKILARSDGGRVEILQVGKAKIKGRAVREALGLRSADFKISFAGDSILLTTEGFGHGVGLSQYGADGMGKAGFDYKEILKHFYSGVDVK